MTDFDKVNKVLIGPDTQLELTLSYRMQPLLFLSASLADTKLGVMRPISVKNCTTYLQTTLKKRKATNSLPKTRAGSSAHGLKNDDVKDEVRSIAFLTLSKDMKATISNLIKEIAPVRTMYHAYIKNLAKKRELGVEQNLNRKVDFVLADSPYYVQMNRGDDHADYDAF